MTDALLAARDRTMEYSLFCGSLGELRRRFEPDDTRPRLIVTPNLDHWRMLSQKTAFRRAYRNADIIVNDSRFLDRLVFSGRALLAPGADLVPEILRTCDVGVKICVIGYSQEVRRFLLGVYPTLSFTFLNPSMGYIRNRRERREIVEKISTLAPALILLCTGAPQSEIMAAQIVRELQLPMRILCCGSALNFLSGSKIRAPMLFRRAGAEWLWRFLSEPHTRLRYLSDIVFLLRNALNLVRLSTTGTAQFRNFRIAFGEPENSPDKSPAPR